MHLVKAWTGRLPLIEETIAQNQDDQNHEDENVVAAQ
jgi:hypothetical protein